MKNIFSLQIVISLTLLTLAGPVMANAGKTPVVKPANNLIVQYTAPSACGGGIGGGGGLEDQKGISIDSYMKRIEQIRGYSVVVEPVLNKIKNTLPNFYKHLIKRIKNSGFFVAPHEIFIKLPARTQGIPYDINDFNHAALNNMNDEVWFVEQRMDNKTEEDAGNLLLHEIFMLDFIALTDKKKLNDSSTWSAIHSSTRRIGGYFRLHSDDSQDEVRDTVITYYREYISPYVIDDLFETKSEVDEFNFTVDNYLTSLKTDVAQLCSHAPTLSQLDLMNNTEFQNIMPLIAELAELIYSRFSWVVSSENLSRTNNLLKAKVYISNKMVNPLFRKNEVRYVNNSYFKRGSYYLSNSERASKTDTYKNIRATCLSLDSYKPGSVPN